MKRLLIIGASILQLPAILKAKEMGLYVGVADFNPQAIGVYHDDEYINVSIEPEENLKQMVLLHWPQTCQCGLWPMLLIN